MGRLVYGFVRTKVKEIHINKCHAPPNAVLDEYEQMLSTLDLDARGQTLGENLSGRFYRVDSWMEQQDNE